MEEYALKALCTTLYYKVIKPCFLVVALPRCDTSVYIPFKK